MPQTATKGGSFLPLVERLCGETPDGSERRVELSPDGSWIRVRNGTVPQQGWKLHVSAAFTSSQEVLLSAVPVLLAEGANFKVAASADVLAELNNDGLALSQVGKFITVYPKDDAQAVRLAVVLDEATRGQRGPAIPSDRAVRPGSLVHYRYGGFGDLVLQTPIGALVPALTDPGGELVPDVRLPLFTPPDWATDPFAAAGITVEAAPARPLVAGRFLIVKALSASTRGDVCLAVDIEQPGRVVLKRAPRDASMDAYGRDARDRLRHEHEVLQRLGGGHRWPAVHDLFEDGDDLFLVVEDVEGEPLERHVMQLVLRGRTLAHTRVVELGRELASLLGAIHEHGFVYRDVKSPNVVITPGGLRLVDFELAHELGSTTPPFGRGTRGYTSPEQTAGEPPAITDDVYGLGALLYFMATAAEPSLSPRALAPLDRPLELLNPGLSPVLVDTITRCLAKRAEVRFQSMSELDAALAGAADRSTTAIPALAYGPESAARARSRELARRVGDSLCQAAVPSREGDGVEWITTHDGGWGMRARDVNIGSAGTLLALAELVAELGDPEHTRILRAGARRLAVARRLRGEPLPGLYVGEAGVGTALLRAAQVLGDEPLREAARERGRRVAGLPHRSPDLFNGTAGRLRFHLLLWDETGDPSDLVDASACGDYLLGIAEAPRSSELAWQIPPGYDGLSGDVFLGYAHGAAGIADSLLDLFEATEDERFLRAAKAAGRLLSRLAVPVLEDESGLDWPSVEGSGLFGAFWCHGAAGVGRFFLHLAQVGALPDAGEIAERAARAVARSTRGAGPTQCHGLAGSIELLLDVYRATGDEAHLVEARSLALLLEAFALERDGDIVFPSELPGIVTPDYMVGYAGIAACLLRLGDPQRVPTALSREGFGAGAR